MSVEILITSLKKFQIISQDNYTKFKKRLNLSETN